jgi:DNA adenine methylase
VPARLPELLSRTAERLLNTQLECLPYEQILQRYDGPGVLFYCDPPYAGVRLYRHNFTIDDFRLLAERLASLQGQFLLSLNDTPLTRQLFGQFYCREVSLVYGSSRLFPTATELLFSNRPFDQVAP